MPGMSPRDSNPHDSCMRQVALSQLSGEGRRDRAVTEPSQGSPHICLQGRHCCGGAAGKLGAQRMRTLLDATSPDISRYRDALCRRNRSGEWWAPATALQRPIPREGTSDLGHELILSQPANDTEAKGGGHRPPHQPSEGEWESWEMGEGGGLAHFLGGTFKAGVRAPHTGISHTFPYGVLTSRL